MKYIYSGYGITFDGLGSLGFGNGFASNVIIFGVDTRLSSHSDNLKNNFLVSSEGPNDDINDGISTVEQNFRINFIK